MHAAPEEREILYVTEQQLDPETAASQVGLDAGVVPVGAGAVTDVLASSGADGLLVGADVDRERTLDLLHTLTVAAPETPVVVFVDGEASAFSEQVLQFGAVEIVRGTVATTPPALVQRRIESARTLSFTRSGAATESGGQMFPPERELIEEVLETSPVGIVALDANGTVTRANEQAAEILGVPKREIEGVEYVPDRLQLYDVDGEKLDPASYPVRAVLEDGERITDEQLVVEQPTGDQRILTVDGAPLFENGDLQRAILTFEDVTDSVEREQRLTEQRNELAKLDQLNRIIRGVDEALLGATSRAEITKAVCEQLVASNRYRFAVALQSVADGELELDRWVGPAEEFLDRTHPTSGRTPANCPGLRAAKTGEPQTIQDLSEPAEFATAPWQEAALEAGVQSMVAVPVRYEDQVYEIITVYATVADTVTDRELDVLAELGETVGYAIAATERREREQILTALYETTQDLLAAERRVEITDTVVDVASEVLDAPGVGICLFDDEENSLKTVSATDELVAFYGGVTVFGPGEENSATWQAYATGETKFFQDIRDSEHVVNPETRARSTLLIPLGEHGVFVVASAQNDVFSDQRRRLIGLLAATTEAALDRVAGRADLREQNRELEATSRRVDRLETLLGIHRGVEGLLGDAGTRAEIETGVCEQLLAGDSHAFAWIGAVAPQTERVEPTAWAGSEDDYLDVAPLAATAREPTVQAATTGEPVSRPDVTDHLQETEWARHAADRDIQSVVAVPLVHAGVTYGVLGLYATEPAAFDDLTQAVLEQIGETTAYAINSVETRQGALGEHLTELELSISQPGTFLNAVARTAGEPVTYRKLTSQPDGSARVLFSLESVDVDDVLALEGEFVSVDSLSAVKRTDEYLFQANMSGQTVAATVLDCGGIPDEIVATGEETTAVVRLSQTLDVRLFLDRVTEQFADTELVSRQRIEQAQTGAAFTQLDEELTDRQREVLVTAYESGFFESPRETTGEELAALLDLAQPTVTHHLREAQRRVFATLLDTGAGLDI